MASYLQQTLAADETVRHQAALSLWPYALWILLGVLLLPAFGVGLLILVPIWIKIHSTELDVTNKRILLKTGFISRSTVELNLRRLESIEVRQSVWGRMFHYGTVIISGTGTTHEPIVAIKDPLAFRREALAAQDSGPGLNAV